MGIEAFGIFSICLLFVQFINSIQFSLISSPMMFLGPKRKVIDKQTYFGSIFVYQLFFSVATSVVIWVILNNTNIFNLQSQISNIATPLVIVIFIFQNQDFLRRFLFVQNQYFFALLIDVVSYLGRFIFLFFFLRTTIITLDHVFWSISFSAFLSILLCTPKIRILKFDSKYLFISYKEHWLVGKWLVIATLLRWTSGNYFIITAGVILGPVAVGAIKAAENILGILNIFLQGLENIIPTRASSYFHKGSISTLAHYLFSIYIWGSVLIIFIILFVIIFASTIIDFFYGNEFSGLEVLIYLYSICYFLSFLILPLRCSLIILDKSKYIFTALIGTTIIALVTAKLFLVTFSSEGAVYGIILTQLASIAFFSFYLRKEYKIRIKKITNKIVNKKK